MADKRARGVCYGCDEKFERGHRCARKQLYLLEIDEGVHAVEIDSDPINEEIGEEENLMISIHAINGSSSRGFITMRVTGRIGRRALHILIDSGSTHNFLDLQVAKKLGLLLTGVNPVYVDVADGNRLECKSMCKGLQWSLRGTTFVTDVLLLPLRSCDMVLGIQWLETLGDIQWNFKTLTMDFTLNGMRHLLRGGHNEQIVHAVSDREMRKILGHNEGIQLCCIQLNDEGHSELFAVQDNGEEKQQIPHPIQLFLEEQTSAFAEPTTLPPMRSHKHKISLVHDATPVNSRSYRHSALQKNIIEKQDKYPIPLIDELLKELRGATVFSKIDLRAGYHQIRMEVQDIPKTAFKTHDGHFEFAVRPFGLTNAPATFQSLMNDVFRPFLRKFVLIEYLGHIISEKGVSTDPKKVQAMQTWPTPSDVSKLRGLLGLTGYYIKFMASFANLSLIFFGKMLSIGMQKLIKPS
ncbi:uncharacterized protein LOC121774327 [Salvia splendens]|uniref:uncharacterized protein LOC121774327 n=1 Tax=Salvia splendens TaxID=180675 RepID=UPI001C27B3ED|nr:uncharacterized protein LOC121774327 [Salvia splendens]